MRVGGIAIGIILAAASCTLATPLDFAQVSAGATWVAHFDFDAAQSSLVCQQAYEKLLATHPDVGTQLDLLRRQLGLDVPKHLRGVTVYGSKIGKNHGVLLVHGVADQKLLLDRVRRAPDHKAIAYRAYELHSWTDAKGKEHEHTIAGAIYKAGLVVLAPTVDELQPAMDVLEGRLPSLKAERSPLSVHIPAGTIGLLRAVGLSRAELPYMSPLVTQSETFNLTLGEQQGEAFVEAQLSANSAETAAQLKSLLEGLRAIAELQRADEPDLVQLVRKLRVEITDKAVHAEFRAPANKVWALIEGSWNRTSAALRSEAARTSGGKK